MSVTRHRLGGMLVAAFVALLAAPPAYSKPTPAFDAITLPMSDMGSVGDLSGLCAKPAGATACRTFRDIAGDTVNVKSFNAVADGSDETAKLQAALTAGAGKTVYIPRTTNPYRTCQLVVPAKTRVVIDGTLKLLDGCVGNLLAVSSEPDATAVDGVTLEGTGVLDGNRANVGSTSLALACVHAYRATNFTMRDLTVQNCKNFPVNVWNGSANVRLSRLVLRDSGNSAQCAATVDNCWVDHLTVSGIGDYGWAFYGPITNSGITHSYLHDNGAGGIAVLADGSTNTTLGSTNITIANNTVRRNWAAGIHVQADAPSTGQHNGVVISGNTSDGNNRGNLPPYGFAYIKNALNVVVTNNVSHDEGNGNATVVGIQVGAGVSFIQVKNNILANLGVGGTGVGIGLTSGTVGADVATNTITDYQATKTLAFGLNGAFSAGSNGRVVGNTVLGAVGLPDNLTYGNDTIRDPTFKTYVPNLSSTAGALGSFTASGDYSYDGRVLIWSAQVALTSKGTATGALIVASPQNITPARACTGIGSDAVSNSVIRVAFNPGDTFVRVLGPTGASILADNDNISFNIVCRVQ